MSAISCATAGRGAALCGRALRRRRNRCRSRPTAGRPAPAMSAPCLRSVMSRCCSRPPTRRSAASSKPRSRGIPVAASGVRGGGRSRVHRRLGEAGFRTRPLAPFSRPVGTKTGMATAAFTVARVEPGEMPEGRIQVLTHHTEDAVWQKRWLAHPNGAPRARERGDCRRRRGRGGSTVCALYRATRGAHASGQAVQLDRGRIDLVTRDTFAAALPETRFLRCRSSAAMA